MHDMIVEIMERLMQKYFFKMFQFSHMTWFRSFTPCYAGLFKDRQNMQCNHSLERELKWEVKGGRRFCNICLHITAGDINLRF